MAHKLEGGIHRAVAFLASNLPEFSGSVVFK